jgi:6-phosphogluconolactonase (cycloisomerase 2 family)
MSWNAYMNRRHMGKRLSTAVGAAALGAAAAKPAAAATSFRAGDVFSLTNAPGANAVAVFARGLDGALTPDGSVPTGGSGTGGSLSTQGALWLSNDRWLFAVNAASNELSVFQLGTSGPVLTDRVSSGGTLPISVTAHNNVVYVLNDGGTANISGFRRSPLGKLSPIAGSTRPLSTAAPDAGQISFSPNGRHLVVTEKGTNRISTYRVGVTGVASDPTPQDSHGQTPFGFAFSPLFPDQLVVTEANGGVPSGSAVSSYRLHPNGQLQVLDGSVPTTQNAACWAAITPNGRYAYAANAASGTISGFLLAFDGQLTLLQGGVSAGMAGLGPLDIAIDRHGRNLYVLYGGPDTIGAYTIQTDGSLTALPGAPSMPNGATSVVAR